MERQGDQRRAAMVDCPAPPAAAAVALGALSSKATTPALRRLVLFRSESRQSFIFCFFILLNGTLRSQAAEFVTKIHISPQN